MSWPPPAPSPTTKVIGRCGKSWALPAVAVPSETAASAATTEPSRRVFVAMLPLEKLRRRGRPLWLRFEPLAEMRKGARVRHFGHRLVVGVGTAMIGKSMNHAGIDEGLHVRIAGDGWQNLSLQQFGGRGVVELAEMQDQRARYGLTFVREQMDTR